MRQSHRIIYNVLAGYAGQLVAVVTSLLLIPFLIHRLGEEKYGVFLLVSSVVAILQIVQANIAKVTTVFMASHLARGDYERATALLSSSNLILTGVGFVGGSVLILARGIIVAFFLVPTDLTGAFQFCVALMGVQVALTFPISGYLGLLLALQRYDIDSARLVVAQILRAMLVVCIFSLTEARLEILVAIDVGIELFRQVWVVLATRRLCPQVKYRLQRFDAVEAWGVVKYGFYVFMKQVAAVVAEQGPSWIIGGLIGVAQVTYYYLIVVVLKFAGRLVRGMTLVLVPVASRYTTKGAKEKVRELLVRGTRYSFVLTGLILVVGISLARPFYAFWLGGEYAFLAPFAVVVLAAGAIGLPANCAQQILFGAGEVRRLFVATASAAVISLSVLAAIIGLTDAHYWAMALSAAALHVSLGIAYNMLAIRYLGVSWRRLIWRSYLLPGMGFLPAVLVTALILQWWEPPSLYYLAIPAAVAAILFLGFFLFVVMNKDEWRLAWEVCSGLRERIFRRRKPEDKP